VQDYFVRHGRYTAGVATRYAPSLLTGHGTHQALAKGFQIGTRLHSAPVIRLADGKPMQIGKTVEADGRWRMFAFGDRSNPADDRSAIRRLCRFLAEDPSSPIRRHTPADHDIDTVIDVRVIFQQQHRSLSLEQMPALLLPATGKLGLTDYEKMFCADPALGRDIFEMRGIDRDRGCVVVVRPDQYVAHVLGLDDTAALSAFFAGFLRTV
jgi:phenol 2-monooxygenase (NADPH)